MLTALRPGGIADPRALTPQAATTCHNPSCQKVKKVFSDVPEIQKIQEQGEKNGRNFAKYLADNPT